MENKRPAFVSYAREDESFALRLAADLKTNGANVWLDQFDILPGHQWALEVHQALWTCSELLVILSPPAMKSPHVRDEFGYALDHGKRVIPVYFAECDVHFRLKQLQYVDFRVDYEVALTALLFALTGKHQVKVAITAAGAEASVATEHERVEPGQKAGDTRDVGPAAPLPQASRPRAWKKALVVGAVSILGIAAAVDACWWIFRPGKPVVSSIDVPVDKGTGTPNPEPAPVSTAPATTVPVVLGDALPIRLTLAEDIPSYAAKGYPVRFKVAQDVPVGDTVVIQTGAEATGVIVDGAKKKVLGIGGKMTFQLERVDAVDGQKVNIRATQARNRDGSSKRPVDSGARTTQQVAATAGAQYLGYIDTSNTVMVTKIAR